METLQPKLRFPEFKGTWNRKKIKDVSSNKSGKYNPANKINFVKCIELEHLESSTGNLLGYIDGSKSGSIKNKFEKGDILFGKLRPYLKKYLLASFEGVCSSEIWVLKSINISSEFLFQIIQNDNFIEIANQSSGSKMPRADWDIVSNYEIFIPCHSEQNKIANFLSAVDEKINLLKEKKSLLEDYKKGIMQKIFKQEIRFKDDNGNDFEDWEESILSEIVNLFHGYQFRTTDFTSKGTAVIKIGNVIGNNLNFDNLTFINNERFEDFKNFEINDGDILMSLTGNIGRIIEVKDKPFNLLQNYRVGKFVPFDENKLNKTFLKFLLASDIVFGKFTQLANQSAQANFGKQDMDKIIVKYPCLNEQTKIANFLSAIDEKIELVSTQIEDTQEYKKGLLQQMFI